jgi:ligand-binding sensor domain-containing protein/two-component sensor histidine kinase
MLNVLNAQLPGMKVYTQLDGFPGTVGYLINQDAKGFMWIGTDNGVASFDGKKFTVIDNEQGLTDKEILMALPYSKQYILNVPLLNNISYWKNGKVITSAQNKTLNIISNHRQNIGIVDKVTQKAWIADNINYGYLYNVEKDSVRKIKIDSVPSPFHLAGVVNDVVYLTSYEPRKYIATQFSKYDVKSKQVTPFEFVNGQMENYLKGNNVANIKVSDDGKYAVFTFITNQIDVFKIQSNKLSKIASLPPEKTVRRLKIDRNNHLWVTLNSGVRYWGYLGGLTDKSQAFALMEGMTFNDVFVDRDNNIWFTTEQKGLCFISARHWANAKLIHQLKIPQYPAKYVTGDNKNSIIIGHSGKSCFTYINNGKSTVHYMPNSSPIGVRQILKKENQVFLVSKSLFLFNTGNEELSFKELTKDRAIKDIVMYNSKSLLLADNHTLSIIEVNNENHKKSTFKEIFKRRATAVEVLPDKSIMIGTPNGIFIKKTLNAFAFKMKNKIFSSANITDIKLGRGKNVLIGTNAQGLYRYNYATGNIFSVNFSGNKKTGFVKDIYRQSDSVFWISTDKGVYRVNFNTTMTIQGIDNYTFFDGLPSSNAAATYVHNDTAYVATDAGVGVLPLNSQLNQLVVPELWLKHISFNDSIIHFPIHQIDLNHKQNNIQLSLSAIAYENIGNIKYVYRLNGLSNQWVETENPEISFSGLSHGEYQLEAYAINVNGKRSTKPLLLSIIVHPAFWQTSWFKTVIYILALLLLSLGIYWFVITSKNKQLNRVHQKRKLAELELEAIKAQINPHFIFNCLNSIQSFSYKNQHESVQEYIRLFAKLIRQTMDYSQETFITLEEEVSYLDNYLQLEKIRFKEKLEYILQVDHKLDTSTSLPAMLVQPYVENALKHSINAEGSCNVQISFAVADNGGVTITIKDSGPGIEYEKRGQSINTLGMRLSGSRVSTYNQLFNLGVKLQVQTNTGAEASSRGTTIKLSIPLIKHDIKKI